MNVMLFGPELYYLGAALVFFFLTLKRKPEPKADYQIAMALGLGGLLVTGLCLCQHGELFFKAYRVDLFSQIFKFALALGFFLVLTICHNLPQIAERDQAEFYLFLTTTTIGMMLLVSSVELLTIYVALELSSYSLYILVPLRRGDGIDVEAGIKYLLIGAVSSGVMLFGLSYLFGATGSTYLADILPKLPQLASSPIGLLGLLLALAGFFFKLSVFPFHFWAPDVYQGAANQVTTFIATASKAAAVALLLRLAILGAGYGYSFTKALVILSIISMTLGNLVAIIQRDFKRLLAYSSIAHAGYFLIGILTLKEAGYIAAIYYALAYLVMNFTVFMVINEVAKDGRDLKIQELAGLWRRSPLLSLSLIVGLFALAGVPPSIGFTGKLLLFTSAMSQGYFWLVLIGAVNGTISLYYYLRVIYCSYFTDDPNLGPITISTPIRFLNYALIAIVLGFGVFPDRIVELAKAAVKTVL
ncbi:MAG: NADH-quinone oxidoreductase subunit N [Syntrophales bacterium]|nr:NADH-quinone oxidoreductase subunit N [Syntrophales bacterium]MDD5641687.1 NADH-quinone oxidoreductase subunit N [Syntrophales bacterium]